MTKPVITVKQQSHITTVQLKGVPFAYVVATNRELASKGLIAVIKDKMNYCKVKGYHYAVDKYEMLLTALGA